MTGKEIIKLIEDNALQEMEVKFMRNVNSGVFYYKVDTAEDVGFENETAIIQLKETKGEYSE